MADRKETMPSMRHSASQLDHVCDASRTARLSTWIKRSAPLVMACCVLISRPTAPAQSVNVGAPRRTDSSRQAAASRLAVDVVKLKSGKSLRGVIVRTDADGSLTLAVSREWLQKADPKLLAATEADEARVRVAALQQLRDRIKRELEKLPEDSGVAAFLRVERKRIEGLLGERDPAEAPQFVWIDLAPRTITRIATTSPERKRIAGWSWHERLASVESRDADDLSRELRRRRIDPSQALPDLSDRLPLRSQGDREWSARMALVTYALGNPLDFQGTGKLLVRTDHAKNGAGADIAPLAAKLLGGQVDSLFKDLLGEGRSNGSEASSAAAAKSPNAWLEPAIREAEGDKARAFRATRVDLSIERRQATVNSVLVVQLNTGKWEVIWSGSDTEDGSQERPQMEATIASDPQVKSALGALKSLGVNGQDTLGSAIRFGAATMAAQQTVNQRFTAYEEPFLRRLDGPPLWWR
jgi:hypothetical protein